MGPLRESTAVGMNIELSLIRFDRNRPSKESKISPSLHGILDQVPSISRFFSILARIGYKKALPVREALFKICSRSATIFYLRQLLQSLHLRHHHQQVYLRQPQLAGLRKVVLHLQLQVDYRDLAPW